MSIWTSRPSTPAPVPRPGVPAGLTPKWSSKSTSNPVSKPPIKELPLLSKRLTWRGVENRGVSWSLKSHKSQIFDKYRIGGEQVDKFITDLQKNKGFIDPREARMLEKTLKNKFMYSKNATERVNSGKWLKIIRDPKIFKK